MNVLIIEDERHNADQAHKITQQQLRRHHGLRDLCQVSPIYADSLMNRKKLT